MNKTISIFICMMICIASIFSLSSCESSNVIKNDSANAVKDDKNDLKSEETEMSKNKRITSIKNKLSEADTELNIALTYITNQSNKYSGNNEKIYESIISRKANFNNSKASLNEALALCGKYSEFSDVKNAIEQAISSAPDMPVDSDADAISEFLDELKTYTADLATARTKIAYAK